MLLKKAENEEQKAVSKIVQAMKNVETTEKRVNQDRKAQIQMREEKKRYEEQQLIYRAQAALQLKKNIDSAQAEEKGKIEQRKKKEEKRVKGENQEFNDILASGENPYEVLKIFPV